MIISASRRTDIPAFYIEWFMNRVREGWCLVPNPFNAKQVARISLAPADVEGIVFWSKNPFPMLKCLHELDNREYRYYFQYTLNNYPAELEPHVPGLSERIETFRKLSKRLGKRRVVWRYDPIIVSSRTTYEYHLDMFSDIARELEGFTNRVVVSVVDYYEKTRRRLLSLEHHGYSFDFDDHGTDGPEMRGLLGDMARIAEQRSMQILTCAEKGDFSDIGLQPGRCIDNELLCSIGSPVVTYKKDPYQRSACQCAASKDIGIVDTCTHGCVYCYSTRGLELAERRKNEHDPRSPLLWGRWTEPTGSPSRASESEIDRGMQANDEPGPPPPLQLPLL